MTEGRFGGLIGITLLCAVAILAALLELLLVPLRWGTAFVPISIPFALVGNVVLPRTARWFVDRTGAMAATFAAWLLPMLILALTPRPEGDVLVPGGGGTQWVYYAVLLGGAAAGTATLVLGGPRPAGPRAQLQRGSLR